MTRERTIEDLSPKEKDFCMHYCEIAGDNYCNKSGAATAAGYKSNVSAAAARLLKRPAIREYCNQLWEDNCATHNITPHRVLSDLEDAKRRAMVKKDYAVVTRCIELTGKYLAMFTENMVFSNDEARQLSEREEREAMRIANVLNREDAGRAVEPETQPQAM